MTGSANDHRTAKQRILEAADYLFDNEGIHHVAIDRIIADPGRVPTATRSTTPAAGPSATGQQGRRRREHRLHALVGEALHPERVRQMHLRADSPAARRPPSTSLRSPPNDLRRWASLDDLSFLHLPVAREPDLFQPLTICSPDTSARHDDALPRTQVPQVSMSRERSRNSRASVSSWCAD